MREQKTRTFFAVIMAIVLSINMMTPAFAAKGGDEPTAEESVRWTNHARGRTVYSDDEVWPDSGGADFKVSNVTDGNPNTRWAPKNAPCSLVVDLGEQMDINRFVLKETAEYAGRVKSFVMSYSSDNDQFTTFYEGTDIGTMLTEDTETVHARYIQLKILEVHNVDGPNIASVELYNTTEAGRPEPENKKIAVKNVTASSFWSDGRVSLNPENAGNGMGLDHVGDPLTFHGLDQDTQMWHTADNTTNEKAWIQFEFEKESHIDEMYVWNFYHSLPSLAGGRGMRKVKIEYSLDPVQDGWKQLQGSQENGLFELAQATSAVPYLATNQNGGKGPVAFRDVLAKYVRITAELIADQGAWDTNASNVGLAEVMFTGQEVLSEKEQQWQDFLNDTSWWDKLNINSVGGASQIMDPNGGTLQLEVTENPYLNIVTDQVSWSVDDSDIATVSKEGLVTAKRPGSVTVTAKANLDGVEKSGRLAIDIFDKDVTYKDSFDELIEDYEVPEWFRDAKFGVFVHWGVYSVPAFSSEWIPRDMYQNGWVKEEMIRRYGPLSERGYKDFIQEFTADQYDPGQWADLFEKAGAKYVVPVAEHHDGVAMYDSELTRWNMADIGPEKDLIEPLMKEVRKRGMKFGVSNHFLENEFFYDGARNDPNADASDPRWFDLYNNATKIEGGGNNYHYTSTHMQMWYNRSKELIDKFNPDLLWYDWTLDVTRYTEQMLSYYYNQAEKTNPDGVVVNYKHNLPDGCAVYDIERGQAAGIRPMAWQTDTSISDLSWGYIENDRYKNPVNLINLLIDVVSKNGNLLLNVGPDKYGAIPEDAVKTFTKIGEWLDINGEGIYSTRPWITYGEGPTKVEEGKFAETNTFTSEDIRFTISKDNKNLYLIGMKWPDNRKVSINALNKSDFPMDGLKSISLLGSSEKVTYSQDQEKLSLDLPETNPSGEGYPYIIKLNFEEKAPGESVVNNVSASSVTMEPAAYENQIKISGSGLEDGILVQAFADGTLTEEIKAYTSGSDAEQKTVLKFPANTTGKDMVYEIKISLDDGDTWRDAGVKITHFHLHNLLKGAAMSNKGSNWPGEGPERAIDGDPVSRWSNQDEHENTWLEIDLGGEKTFNQLVIDEYVNLEDPGDLKKGRITDYTISYWDGKNWITCFDSSSGEYEVTRPDPDTWCGELDKADNLFRDKNGNIMQAVHRADFQEVTAQKLRIDFQVKKEVSIFEMRLVKERKNMDFVDVKETDWFYDAVSYVYRNKYMTGLDPAHFGPAQNLSRAQFATILYRIENSPEISYQKTFPDVPKDQFYTEAVLWANKSGIVTGYEDGKFGPADEITREQMAVMMYRYARYKKYDTSKSGNLDYPDGEDVSQFAEKGMKWAVSAGLISGNADGTLAPQGQTSRAVCATIIQRFMEKVK